MICLNILRGLLPKIDPDKGEPPEDHIKRFMMVIRLMGVQHEDVVCRLFPYTFEGKDSMWYFSLRQGSITSWAQFEAAFMHKFRDEKTPDTLMVELSQIKMNDKDRIKDRQGLD